MMVMEAVLSGRENIPRHNGLRRERIDINPATKFLLPNRRPRGTDYQVHCAAASEQYFQ